MQYALVAGVRREASVGIGGTCPACGSATVARCGTRKIHHWAHRALKDCDQWWENETDWHRAWKNHYPAECREVVHFAPDGEIHRSDIKTPGGIYIEVQHSHLPEPERLAREAFYGNLIWVLDGRSFRKSFEVCHELPHPRSLLAEDIVWCAAHRRMKGLNSGMFYRLSQNGPATKANFHSVQRFVQINPACEIQAEVQQNYVGHHQFYWTRPHESWLASGSPVYIDFGDEVLLRLQVYDESGLRCVRLVSRTAFLKATLSATRAADVVPD